MKKPIRFTGTFLIILFTTPWLCLAQLDSHNTLFNLRARFTETMITLQWDSIPGAAAYDVYADYGTGMRKANFKPVVIRPQYSLLWIKEGDEKKRIVKGYRLALQVVPLKALISGADTSYADLPMRSIIIKNSYLHSYDSVLTGAQCASILRKKQKTPRLPGALPQSTRQRFIAGYPVVAQTIATIYAQLIDPRDEGACVPFSTLVSKYFTARGIPCFRASGQFIEQFHNFNVVIIDSVEYVLDFTADQFIPGSAPVLIPRDCCYIDSLGRPTEKPAVDSTRFYIFDRLYAADQISFSETATAVKYQRILDSLVQQK